MTTPSSTEELLDAVQACLEQLRWEGEPAFGRVARFDQLDLAVAVGELQTMADRLCLLVYEGDRYETLHAGRQIHVRRTALVSLLMADRQVANRTEAVFGGSGLPGVVALKDLVLGLATGAMPMGSALPKPVTGRLFPGVYVRPVSATPLPHEGRPDALVGRGVWLVRLELVGGQLDFDLGQQPIV